MKIGVYGLGRFGSFWATLLQREFDVCGYTRSGKIRNGAEIPLVSKEELCSCDALFLCNSISSMPEVLDDLVPYIKKDIIVFDTCSVKVFPLEQLKSKLPGGCQIIGTHPMFGPDSARNGVDGLPIVYSPVRTDEKTERFWHNAFVGLGLKVLLMTPDEHDQEAAYTQGITHFLGRVLKDLDLKPSSMGTLGYSRLLDIMEQTCNDPWQLFSDLQRYNPYTADMRLHLRLSIEKIIGKII